MARYAKTQRTGTITVKKVDEERKIPWKGIALAGGVVTTIFLLKKLL